MPYLISGNSRTMPFLRHKIQRSQERDLDTMFIKLQKELIKFMGSAL